EIQVSDEIVYFDQGSNFEFVQCPQCRMKLDTQWWGSAMDRAFHNKHFENLDVQTPCGHDTNLNDLAYYWLAGFARFIISYHDPERDFDSEQIRTLGELIGCSLR